MADQGLALNFGLDFELYLFEAFVQIIDQQLGSLCQCFINFTCISFFETQLLKQILHCYWNCVIPFLTLTMLSICTNVLMKFYQKLCCCKSVKIRNLLFNKSQDQGFIIHFIHCCRKHPCPFLKRFDIPVPSVHSPSQQSKVSVVVFFMDIS